MVDDDADARRAMCRTLEFHGYTTVEASSGDAGIRILGEREEDIDLVLVDIVMPEMSGLTFTRRILDEHSNARVLLTSGYADRGIPDLDSPDNGMQFLQKPMTIHELAQKVRDVLDGDATEPDPQPARSPQSPA